MSEKFNKFIIYFKSNIYSYWTLSDNSAVVDFTLKKYPISIKQRILEFHYPEPDENGIPILGKGLYHYTTICSYGLGNWELFLDTKDKKYLDKVILISDFLLKNISSEGAWIQAACGTHAEGVSAMIQGEAISLLCRAWEITKNEKYLNTAQLAKRPFTQSIANGGVLGKITKSGSIWYEEFTDQPLRHVLNGKIYSLWGLHDLWLISKDAEAKELFDSGIDSLITNLDEFDSGYWSYYWLPEDGFDYMASIMYHNLHICQLWHTYDISKKVALKEKAQRFEKYSKSTYNRLKSGYSLFKAKLKKK